VADVELLCGRVQGVCPHETAGELTQAVLSTSPLCDATRSIETEPSVIVALRLPFYNPSSHSSRLVWYEIPTALFLYLMWCEQPIPGTHAPSEHMDRAFYEIVDLVFDAPEHMSYIRSALPVIPYCQFHPMVSWLQSMNIHSDVSEWMLEEIPPPPSNWYRYKAMVVNKITSNTTRKDVEPLESSWEHLYWSKRLDTSGARDALDLCERWVEERIDQLQAQAIARWDNQRYKLSGQLRIRRQEALALNPRRIVGAVLPHCMRRRRTLASEPAALDAITATP
jgi:hypothetical protein